MLDIQTGNVSVLPGSESLIVPAMSPDGRFLAATTTDRLKLMLFDFATQKWADLAKTDVGSVKWTRDGKISLFRFRVGPGPGNLPCAHGRSKAGASDGAEGFPACGISVLSVERLDPGRRSSAAA